jgi:hypothetical protein
MFTKVVIADIDVRGCTHKNYASLDKNEKNPCVFFIATNQSTPKYQKFGTYSKDSKELKKELKRE